MGCNRAGTGQKAEYGEDRISDLANARPFPTLNGDDGLASGELKRQGSPTVFGYTPRGVIIRLSVSPELEPRKVWANSTRV